MGIKINDEQMASSITRHSAMADGDGWIMTWPPGRALTRSRATTAMVLARAVAAGIGDHTDPRWPCIQA